MIKVLMEDEDSTVRSEAVRCLHIDSDTIEYLVIKTLDVDHQVRAEVYKKLKLEWSSY